MASANGWFAARPSGTEDVYKIYAESLISAEHLQRIQAGGAADRRRCAERGVTRLPWPDKCLQNRQTGAGIQFGQEPEQLIENESIYENHERWKKQSKLSNPATGSLCMERRRPLFN